MSLAQRIFRLRLVIIILFGILCFALGALFLSVEQRTVSRVVVVSGTPALFPGREAAFRVHAVRRSDSAALPVSVAHAALRCGDTESAATRAVAGRPAVLGLRVPPECTETAAVTLRALSDGQDTRDLVFSLPIMDLPGDGLSVVGDSTLSSDKAELAVDVVPEDGVIAYGFDNRLFVRVLSEAGTPVVADVTASYLRREMRGMTDAHGLVEFPLDRNFPRYNLKVTARDALGRQGETAADLRPVPRGRRLRLVPTVATPGSAVRIEIATWDDALVEHCDLLQDGAIIDSFALSVRKGRADHTFAAPPGGGTYVVQCASYFRTPGAAYATRALVVTDRDVGAALQSAWVSLARATPSWVTRAALPTDEAVRPPTPRDSAWLAAVTAPGAPPGRSEVRFMEYWAARVAPPHTGSAILHSTLADDEAGLAAERAQVKRRILVALAVALFALVTWAVALVATNIREVHARSAALDEATAEGLVTPTLGRAHAMLTLVVFVVLLALDVLGILWLLDLVG